MVFISYITRSYDNDKIFWRVSKIFSPRCKGPENRIELPQYQQEYSESEFEVITETYNWGRAVFQGWLCTEGNPVHCIMNIYFTGNMVYVIDED